MRWRFATKEDAPTLAKWAVENPDIPIQDAKSIVKHKTTEAIIIEEDGQIILILPFYCVINTAYFGFNPEADGRKRIRAMNAALEVMEKFATDHNIQGIQGVSDQKYNIARFYMKKGFQPEDRQLFVKTLPREDRP